MQDRTDNTELPRVKSAARTTSILLAVAESPDGLTAKEISLATAIGIQSTYQFLQTLRICGFLFNKDGRYVLGLAVVKLASSFSNQVGMPAQLEPLARNLAQESGETVYAAGWWQGEITVFASVRGGRAVLAAEVPIGLAVDGHARASGKYLLAHASPTVLESYLAKHRLTRRTPQTIVNGDRFRAELSRVKKHGYATDIEEFAEGVCCLAHSVAGLDDFVLALSAPRDRFHAEFERYLALMKSC